MKPTIDRKFVTLSINPVTGKIYTEKNSILFTAKDKALPATLEFYLKECERIGCEPVQIESIQLLIDRVKGFQQANESHIPDIVTVAEAERCIQGIGIDD